MLFRSDIYRVMRPGEPPTVEAASALFDTLFFDSERYDLSAVGRVKMNMRLALDAEDTQRTLRSEDIVACVKALVDLRDGKGEVVLAFQAVDDGGTYVQIMEYSESSVKLSVERELTIITPEDYKLSQNYPNPFNPTTEISFTLDNASNVNLTVFNMLGQVVKVLENASLNAGIHSYNWDGKIGRAHV